MLNQVDSSPVIVLLCYRSPITILRLVITVIIPSFDRSILRLSSHILKKILERMLPSFADLYASSSVVGVKLVIRIAAPSAHINPSPMLRSIRHSMFLIHI